MPNHGFNGLHKTLSIKRYCTNLPFCHIFTVRKRSCGKVMFSQACVKNSIHKGEGCSGPGLGGLPRGVKAQAHGGCLPRGVQVQGQGGVEAQAQRDVKANARRGCPGPGLAGCPGPGPGGVQAQAWGVSRPRPRGCPGPHLGGAHTQAQGVSRPRPRGCIPACTEGDSPPPSRWLLLWTVCILLECILVLP